MLGAPDLTQHGLTSHQPTFITDEQLQHPPLGRRQPDIGPVTGHGVRSQIHPHRPESDDWFLIYLVLANTPCQHADTGKQLIHREWFGDVVVSPSVKGFHLLGRPGSSRDHQDRRRRPAAHRLNDLYPVETRHPEIQQNDVRLVIDGHLQGVLPITRQQDLVSPGAQSDPQGSQKLRVVISDKNSH